MPFGFSWQQGLEALQAPDNDFFQMPMPVPKRLPTSFYTKGDSFMLLSGVTAKKEQCLVSQGGLTEQDAGSLALESCDDAMRFGDGRELFTLQSDGQLMANAGKKCVALALQENGEEEEAGGRTLALTDCDGNGDLDRISWRLTPQNTFRALSMPRLESHQTEPHDLDLCLSLRGKGPVGSNDVAQGGIVHATSTADHVGHGANRVNDGMGASYWASEFNPQGEVILQVDLGRKIPIKEIEIKWECPAQNFRVETLREGGWVQQFSSPDPALAGTKKKGKAKDFPVTHIQLDGVKGSAVRVVMEGPAAPCQTAKGMKVFGVREFIVNAERRPPFLEACDMKGGDARSKWFLSYAGQWHPCKRLPDFKAQFL